MLYYTVRFGFFLKISTCFVGKPRLDVYILDYLVKRKLIASAKVFEDEAKVPANVRGK